MIESIRKRKKMYFDIMKDVKMRKIRLLNVFHYRKRYSCPDCCKEISGKNFHRHIDDCKESHFEKTLCNRCLRDCVEATPVFFENEHVYFHNHLCCRPRKKINRQIKYESYLREKKEMGIWSQSETFTESKKRRPSTMIQYLRSCRNLAF